MPEVFYPETLESLGDGQMAVGHVRYGTTGNAAPRFNAQPLVVQPCARATWRWRTTAI